jgi:simple sugar transport system ATP-binding protein
LTVLDERNAPAVRGLTLAVGAGEIYGVAGIDGNGQAELAEALAGVRSIASGRVLLNGQDITNATPRQRNERGFALITDDRQRKGLILDFSVAENLILKSYRNAPISTRGFLQRGEIARFAETRMDAYAIRAAGVHAPVSSLSGGNQQKVVIARELSHAGSLLVAVNPTRGLDVGATEYVHEALLTARNNGMAILLISTELDEILTLSDRIGVLFDGAIREVPSALMSAILTSHAEMRTLIGRWMLGRGEGAVS